MEKLGEKGETLSEAIESLPFDDCRYLIADYVIHMSDGRVVSRTILINWVPQSTKLKLRMAFSTNKKAVTNYLTNIQVEIVADNKEDLTDDQIREKVKKSI